MKEKGADTKITRELAGPRTLGTGELCAGFALKDPRNASWLNRNVVEGTWTKSNADEMGRFYAECRAAAAEEGPALPAAPINVPSPEVVAALQAPPASPQLPGPQLEVSEEESEPSGPSPPTGTLPPHGDEAEALTDPLPASPPSPVGDEAPVGCSGGSAA